MANHESTPRVKDSSSSSDQPPLGVPAPLDLEPIRQRITLAQRIYGVSFDGYPDLDREPVDIQRDRDRAALLAEVEARGSRITALEQSIRGIDVDLQMAYQRKDAAEAEVEALRRQLQEAKASREDGHVSA